MASTERGKEGENIKREEPVGTEMRAIVGRRVSQRRGFLYGSALGGGGDGPGDDSSGLLVYVREQPLHAAQHALLVLVPGCSTATASATTADTDSYCYSCYSYCHSYSYSYCYCYSYSCCCYNRCPRRRRRRRCCPCCCQDVSTRRWSPPLLSLIHI